jgi:U3 small nucleolar RNA-associated protein 15
LVRNRRARALQVVASVVDELAARGGLTAALSGRDAEGVLPVVQHLQRHVTDPRYSLTLSAVCHRFLDMYGGWAGDGHGAGGAAVASLAVLSERVRLELLVQEQLACIKGMLEPLLSASVV